MFCVDCAGLVALESSVALSAGLSLDCSFLAWSICFCSSKSRSSFSSCLIFSSVLCGFWGVCAWSVEAVEVSVSMLSARTEIMLAILRERERERNRVLKRSFVLVWHFCCKCVCKSLFFPLCFLCVLDFCADRFA